METVMSGYNGYGADTVELCSTVSTTQLRGLTERQGLWEPLGGLLGGRTLNLMVIKEVLT